jgi:hypothetical protein
MGFFHMFADARMPIWGVLAILSNFLLAVLSKSGQRWFCFASLSMLGAHQPNWGLHLAK